MAFTSEDLFAAATNKDLNQRTCSAAVTEAYNNPVASQTEFATRVKQDPFGTPVRIFQWPVAINCLASYQSGLASGGDGASNVLDSEILAAVQAHWPADS